MGVRLVVRQVLTECNDRAWMEQESLSRAFQRQFLPTDCVIRRLHAIPHRLCIFIYELQASSFSPFC